MTSSKLWWRTSLPVWKRLWYMWKYRGYRMGDAMNEMYNNVVARANEDKRGL